MNEVYDGGYMCVRPTVNECNRLNAAYDALKADCGPDNYARLLQALEDDLREGAAAHLPGTPEGFRQLVEGGKVNWNARTTPQGLMLSVFTSDGQVRRHDAPCSAAIKLEAFFQVVAENDQIAGFILNPCDAGGGYVIPRAHLELVVEKAREKQLIAGMMRDVVSESLFVVWGNATGVPVLMMTVNDEVGALGGIDRLVAPVVQALMKDLESGSFKGMTAEKFVKEGARRMLETAMLAGVMIKAEPEKCAEKTPYGWYEDWNEEDETDIEDEILEHLGIEDFKRGAELLSNMQHNLGTYFEILEAKVGLRTKAESKDAVWDQLAAHIGEVCIGAACFGVGWGAALYYEQQGPEAVEEAKRKQKELLTPAESGSDNRDCGRMIPYVTDEQRGTRMEGFINRHRDELIRQYAALTVHEVHAVMSNSEASGDLARRWKPVADRMTKGSSIGRYIDRHGGTMRSAKAKLVEMVKVRFQREGFE